MVELGKSSKFDTEEITKGIENYLLKAKNNMSMDASAEDLYLLEDEIRRARKIGHLKKMEIESEAS